MLTGANNIGVGGKLIDGSSTSVGRTTPIGGTSFSDVFKNSLNEVNRLQQDANQAVQDVATGKTENVTGVMTAVEKSELAFKTLLAIRSKLIDAYDEIKGMNM